MTNVSWVNLHLCDKFLFLRHDFRHQLPSLQHETMIEAVENHNPEVIVIDEIGRELEAQAARTIAERGVQLIGTAHGNTLDNLLMNPTLSDLIRPEAPWHGRRRRAGTYGGEPLLGGGPLALLDLFRDWVTETSAWIAWARRSSRGPVAVGGISLGALTGQLVLTAARGWPEAQRPDAALLMAGSGDLMAMAYAGALPSALGLRPRLAAAGWDEARLAPWLGLLEPQGPPAIAPGHIMMLLGGADEVAPPDTGLALARAWGLPCENVLLRRRQGHFTLDLGLLPDPGPLFALARLLKGL